MSEKNREVKVNTKNNENNSIMYSFGVSSFSGVISAPLNGNLTSTCDEIGTQDYYSDNALNLDNIVLNYTF